MQMQAWALWMTRFSKLRPSTAILLLVWLERASKITESLNNYSLKANISCSSINGVSAGDRLQLGQLIYKPHHFISLVVFSVPDNCTCWQTSVTRRKLNSVYLKECIENKCACYAVFSESFIVFLIVWWLYAVSEWAVWSRVIIDN